MKMTIRLRHDLLKRARARAAEEQRTLTSFIEEGIALALARPKRRRNRVALPVSRASGGVLPGVDLNRSADLEAGLQGELP